jgi:hypothetical protein
MYRKVLLIGLGGSGGKTLRFLKRDLSNWLETKGWTDGIPGGWQFLHIDSPTTPDGLEAGGMPLTNKEYVGLVSGGTTLRPLVDRLDGIHNSVPELTGWRVEPATAPNVALEIGCGQYRALGRTVGLSFAQAIKQGLQGAIDRMSAVDVEPELDRLYSKVHGPSAGGGEPAGPPIPIIISSLAGGTGAGLILDVADILHSMRETWADLSMGLYYTSDVFPSSAGSGVHPNGLAAVSEVLNGAWWGGSGPANLTRDVGVIPGKQSPILSQIAGLDRGVRRTGTHCNFLIGATNARGSAIARDGQLFEMVGGALLSWVTDPAVQGSFVAYTAANWATIASGNLELDNDVITNRGADGEPGLPSFSALGFARVSVGTKYLRRYAAQRLAKDAALHMAEGHMLDESIRQAMANENLANPDRIVERIVDSLYPAFRQHMDVAELNRGSAQVDFSIAANALDALTPAAFRDWTAEQHRWIASQVSDEKDANGEAWVERLLPIVRQSQQELERRVGEALPGMVKEWVRLASEKLPVHAEVAVSQHGLRVAVGLLEGLAGEISSRVSGAIAELEQQAQDYRTWSNRNYVEEAARKAMSDILTKGKVASDSEYVTGAIQEAVKYARCSSLVMVAERAALLLERFGADYLRPMAQALREGLSDLNNSSADRNEWPDWSAGMPPQELEPPRSEYTVIEKEDFSATFEMLLRETFSGQSDSAARSEARAEISGGTTVRAMLEPLRTGSPDHTALSALTLVRQEQEWLPGYELVGGAVGARRAMFRARCTSAQVLERADHWLMRSDFPFEELLSVDLRSYTRSPEGGERDSSPEYVDRQNRVISKLEAAVAAAAPLVRLNDGLVTQLHPKMVANGLFRTHLSMIPFRGHPLEARIRESRIAALFRGSEGEQDDTFEKMLTNDADLPYIDIISQLWAPVSPVAIDSLMNPIGEEWSKAQNPAAQVQFWRLRRTRPLREFVPVPQRHLRCMIRGWFTGRILGLIDTSAMPYSIVHDLHGVNARTVRFPSRFLSGAPTSIPDELALTLEAMPLALVEVNRSTSLSPLEPYTALRSLGMTDPTGNDVLAYPRPHPAIVGWIRDGAVPGTERVSGVGSVHQALQGATDANQRRDALATLLETVKQDYERNHSEYRDDVQRNRMRLSLPPLWIGLHDEIQVALDALHKALSAQANQGAGL